MRSALAFVVILAVFSSCQSGIVDDIRETYAKWTNDKKVEVVTSDVPATLESEREPKTILIKIGDDHTEVKAKSGDTSTVTGIILAYESFLKSNAMNDGQGGPFPSVKNVKDALSEGKKFDENSPLCQAGSNGLGGTKQEWYEYLCF